MPVYNITIEASSDWSVVEIMSNATWVKPPSGALAFNAEGEGNVGAISISDRKVVINKKVWSMNRVYLRTHVFTNQITLDLKLAHGDSGAVRVSSGVDTVINDHRLGDGQNALQFKLALTRAAVLETEEARGADLVQMDQELAHV